MIENADPIEVALFATVDANGWPAAIRELPKRPEIIWVLQVNSSPSENCWVELFWVFDAK